ncbi:MAG: TetR/AcrR family transcriptional regulator [Bacteroidia bacterium]|nr:TetR/AcrR family transcriptional regulator [Bacteroidia bacterium]
MDLEAHKERRVNEIAALKVAILASARDMAKKEGWTKVSIRKIAKEVQYTPPVIYEHFKNKEAILINLEEHGFRQLRYRLEEIAEKHAAPLPRLLAISEAYWEWAFDNRELYEVMFNLDGVRCSQPNTQALRESGQCVIETLKQIHLFSSGLEELFFNWWALMHGHVSLILSGQVPGMSHELKGYMKSAVTRFGV